MEKIALEVRQAIVKRLEEDYPDGIGDRKFFLNPTTKVTIDSWIGDCFPDILRKLKYQKHYEQLRAMLFLD